MSSSVIPLNRLRENARVAQRAVMKVAPWAITVVALYIAFHDVDWEILANHLGEANPIVLLTAVLLTTLSYLMRSRRWQFLFPERVITFSSAARVLILGFFMNNILPARAGEFVRAHMGSKVTGGTRTLVLATIASERLADGLMLSLFFVSISFSSHSEYLSPNLFYVAGLFGGVAGGVLFTLVFRSRIFSVVESLTSKVNHKASDYAHDRIKVFINGLAPLCSRKTFPIITIWTFAIWLVELSVFFAVTRAFGADLPLPLCILFLVTVNFSSLIPSAPGGIGVIEAIASAVLISVGVPKEQALTMVIVQHVIQYLVVGIPGAAIMFTWKRQLRALETEQDEQPN